MNKFETFCSSFKIQNVSPYFVLLYSFNFRLEKQLNNIIYLVIKDQIKLEFKVPINMQMKILKITDSIEVLFGLN